jgi:uncharacterized protein (DUF885 family)
MTVEELATALLGAVLDAHPLDGSLVGLSEYDERLPDYSPESQEREVAALRAAADDASRLDDSGLDEVDRQTLDLVRSSADARAGAAAVPFVEFTISDFHAAPVAEVLSLLPKVPLDTDERADAYLARLRAMPTLLETVAARHIHGVGAGLTPVRRLVEAQVAQLNVVLDDRGTGGLRRLGGNDPAFAERLDEILRDVVRPALTQYREVLSSRFVEVGRDDASCGLCNLPDGEAMYGALVRMHTSIARTPDVLHHTGLDMIEQLNQEFREVGQRLWGTSDLDEIMERLRHDPELRYNDGDEIVSDARRSVARAEEAAPNWFGQLPDDACLVEPVPAVEAAGSAPAYYIAGALDGSRRGTYFVNTSRASERSRADAQVIAFHEAVPGHHFQISIAQGQPRLSLPRRVLWDNACAEGWGLYAERLADEMDLYTSDVARLGMLTADAWRAGRLVVDTGIHHLGWGRQQAVNWFSTRTPLSRVVIESEVNRYITWPGQALGYMVGRIELVRLRRFAQDSLGVRFDLRAFHDVMLEAGPVPLPAMAALVERWIASKGGHDVVTASD